jgi:hypothetical protein
MKDERPSVACMKNIRNLYKILGKNPEAKITWGSRSRISRFRRGNACSGFITGKVLLQCLSTY